MRCLLALSFVALCACDIGGPGFYGIEPVTRSTQGSTFSLRLSGDTAQATRVSREWNPRFEIIAARAAVLVQAERPSCRVDWVEGDPSLMTMGLACNGRPAPKLRTRDRFTCRIITDLISDDIVRCREL